MTFKPDVAFTELISLLHSCRGVIYTPSNEHLGIVPLEAMGASVPVIAVASGGPKETIVPDTTGQC